MGALRLGRCQHWRKRHERPAEVVPERVDRWIPSVITFAGHGLAVAWVCGAPLWCIAAALVCDVLDGWIARLLGAESAFGALYDWSADLTVAVLLAWRLGIPWLVVIALPFQIMLHERRAHFSGRTALVGAVLALQFWRLT